MRQRLLHRGNRRRRFLGIVVFVLKFALACQLDTNAGRPHLSPHMIVVTQHGGMNDGTPAYSVCVQIFSVLKRLITTENQMDRETSQKNRMPEKPDKLPRTF